MIKKADFNIIDIDDVMNIWLKSNIYVHNFINQKYWYDNFGFVKKCILNSEVYIYYEDNIVKSFVGVDCGYIAGIFTDDIFRGKGIGTELIKYLKNIYDTLELNVYEKNQKALNFYIKNDFYIKEKSFDKNTNEYEYKMEWKRV